MNADEFELNPFPVIDYDALRLVTSESEFVRISFELTKESMQLLAIAAGIHQNEDAPIGRNQAIVIGHFSRMARLMRSLVRQVADGHGGDQQMSITRQFMDSASTVLYLLGDPGDGSRYVAYVFDSLIAEREFLKNVREQIAKRGGKRLPIEERIERSIATTLAAAGVTELDIPSRRKNGWPSHETLVEMMGPTAYSAYRTGSSAVHGSFSDLEKNYLEHVDGEFMVSFNPTRFRPQPFLMMNLLGLDLVPKYMETYFPTVDDPLRGRVREAIAAVIQIDDLHEAWLGAERRRPTTQEPDPPAQ